VIEDVDQTRRDNLRSKKQFFIEEENHYTRLGRVFGSEDGKQVFEWILDKTGYWRGHIETERQMGVYEFAKLLFTEISLADIEIANGILARRVKAIRASRKKEKAQVDQEIKNLE